MKGQINIKNTYYMYKIVDGKRVDLTHFHNIITKNFKEMLGTDSYNVTLRAMWFGSGSTQPQETDTKLTQEKWTFGWNDSNAVECLAPYLTEDNTWNAVVTFKVPATTAYTGTVSEVGVYGAKNSSSYIFLTHALITDAEGHPMTITKTDTEVLYVDLHIQYQLLNDNGFTWNPYYVYLMMTAAKGDGISVTLPALNVLWLAMCSAEPDLISNGNTMGSFISPQMAMDTTTGVLTCSNGRFGTDNVTEQRYVNSIAVVPAFWSKPSYAYYRPRTPIGWWKFPNKDIFPNTTIKQMRVGTGDAQTTEFTPPLNLWVKDTEKIYVDNVLQQRGVDYTCDHKNNLSKLQELHPSNFCRLLNTCTRYDEVRQDRSYHPLKGGINDVDNRSSYNDSRMQIEWDSTHHLCWEMIEDPQIGLDVDHFYMDITNIASTSWKGAIFQLQYSSDNKTWQNACDAWTYTGTSSNVTNTFEFTSTISARYWKLSIDTTNCSTSLQATIFKANNPSYLGKHGMPIKFTKAPAVNAIITMEADIDRPMKNSKFILDCNPSFQF